MYEVLADDPLVLTLTAGMGVRDVLRSARVVGETRRSVRVAVTYDEYGCDCMAQAIAKIATADVRLHAPLGRRTVIDQFTGRALVAGPP